MTAQQEPKHSHNPAPDLSHIAPCRRSCLNCLNPECLVWQTFDQNCWKSQAEHDAHVAKAAREDVLGDLILFMNALPDAINDEEMALRNNVFNKLKSLRGGKRE